MSQSPFFYSHAPIEKVENQGKAKELRTKHDAGPFETLPLGRDEIKDWLIENKMHDPLETPPAIQEAVKNLETLLGDPIKPKKGFARISTVRIKSSYSTSGPVRRTPYKPGERYDYSVQEPQHNEFVNLACATIVTEFLRTTGYGSFLQTFLNIRDQIDDHRVYAHVDWYPNRNYKAQTWHKDTRGSTLFVGLIYMNHEEIQGPDIISNPHPLTVEMEDKRAPKCLLPSWIKNPIDEILNENQSESMMIRQTGKIPAGGGMVWFIDELVHHRTPQRRAISINDGSLSLAISEKTLGNLPGVVAPESWDSNFETNAPRQFVRIWVTLDKVSKQDL
jgi:hypothetical protein